MSKAQEALHALREEMTGDDLRRLTRAELANLEAICHHWQEMARAERKKREVSLHIVCARKLP